MASTASKKAVYQMPQHILSVCHGAAFYKPSQPTLFSAFSISLSGHVIKIYTVAQAEVRPTDLRTVL